MMFGTRFGSLVSCLLSAIACSGTSADGAPDGSGGGGAVPNGGGGSASAGTGIPCDVAKVLSDHCTPCHNPSLRFSAPMPLMTLADLHAAAHSNAARKVFEVIPERINPQDVAKRMPPTSMPKLTDAEKQTLGSWVAAGAVGSASSCPVTQGVLPGEEPPPGTGGASSTGAGGVFTSGAGGGFVGGDGGGTGTAGAAPGAGGQPSTGHSGGASIEPITYDDPEMQCYKMQAHAQGSKDQPYMKSPGEQYMNFTFAAPWGNKTVYTRAVKLALDPDSKVIHHWLLFKTGAVQDGGISAGTGIHPDGAVLMHGWAPGASPIYLDPDVGMKLEAGAGYTLEVHFNNPGTTPGADHSGAEVCVTPKVPAHEVTLSWVGTDSIFGSSATGSCAPANQKEPIHIIAAQPHMHLKGRHMKVVINHAGGQKETIHDEDFAFENQRYYVLDALLNPGDTMTTTCSYNGAAQFGSSTNQEMCYFFSLAWPAGALANNAGALLHGANTCM